MGTVVYSRKFTGATWNPGAVVADTPGRTSAAADTICSAVRSAWIRLCIYGITVIPVPAPFPDIATHIINSRFIRLFCPSLIDLAITFRSIPCNIVQVITAAEFISLWYITPTCCAFPFRFSGQAVTVVIKITGNVCPVDHIKQRQSHFPAQLIAECHSVIPSCHLHRQVDPVKEWRIAVYREELIRIRYNNILLVFPYRRVILILYSLPEFHQTWFRGRYI